MYLSLIHCPLIPKIFTLCTIQ
uniref:Uncharacterized protein n=1 Tax=Rhizophora mucronata TaxID=61149 RepID=A0A2P2NDX2_RHIMU